MDCIFCNIEQKEYVVENKLAFAIYDKFPVNEGHLLIIPKRHYSSYFDAEAEEIKVMYQLTKQCKDVLDEKYNPDGYNVGFNVGKAAGQTIMHLHLHLIPRYEGDVENPRGGIRNLKPNLVEYIR